jgi:hypothetical protein
VTPRRGDAQRRVLVLVLVLLSAALVASLPRTLVLTRSETRSVWS